MMTPVDYYKSSKNWRSNIRKQSKTLRNHLAYGGAVIVVVFLVLVGGLNAFFPSEGDVIEFSQAITIGRSAKTILSIIAVTLGLLFSLNVLPSIRNWYEPSCTRYRSAADQIIENLRAAGTIDQTKADDLKNISQRLLSPLEASISTADPEEMLIRASYELAIRFEA
jgi:hypothetical protein